MTDDWSKRVLRVFSVPHEEELTKILFSFSPLERVILGALLAVLIISTLLIVGEINKSFTTTVPAPGGSITEGIIGSPRFINPLLATSDADRDLSALVYSGLLRAAADGELAPDLALQYRVSEDSLSYTFTLREDIAFHDGKAVTADDIVYTIERAKDPLVKSPKRANWEGVSIEKVSDSEIKFTLKQPYALFLENATLGILPRHIWNEISSEQFPFSQFNTEPIGSGPYKIEDVRRDTKGFPESYTLKSFEDFTLGNPHLKRIHLRFYPNEEELLKGYRKGEVESIHSISPSALVSLGDVRIEKVPLPRIFAVFFNQNRAPVLAHKEVREALNSAIDKNYIIDSVLGGYGIAIDGPLPPKSAEPELVSKDEEDPQKILLDAGWKRSEEDGVWEKKTKEGTERLSFSIATSNVAELKASGAIIEEKWKALGADVSLQVYEPGDLNQNVIRPRDYDALLFGEIIGRELDLFAFWHSSQRNDPGLNVAFYANIAADSLLEKIRSEPDTAARLLKLKEFENEVRKDTPAVFLYSPDFIYIVPKDLKGISLGTITTPSERFLSIYTWHIETENVWKIFD